MSQECLPRVSSKSVSDKCPPKTVSQACLSRLSLKSVSQECPFKSAPQECFRRVSQHCLSTVHHKSLSEECLPRVSECLGRVSLKTVSQQLVARVVCKLCGTKQYFVVLCAIFVVQSSTGKYFVQALWYKVVLGSTSCKLCSTK